jgi:hypothetical protein
MSPMKNVAAIASVLVVLTTFCVLALYSTAAGDLVRWEHFTPAAFSTEVWNNGPSVIGGAAVVWLIAKWRRNSAARGARASLVARAKS